MERPSQAMMAPSPARVRILCVPVFKRHLLWHAWTDSSNDASSSSAMPDWKTGKSLQEKLGLARQQFSHKVRRRSCARAAAAGRRPVQCCSQPRLRSRSVGSASTSVTSGGPSAVTSHSSVQIGTSVKGQWAALEAAKEGSFQNMLYK